MAAEVEEAHLHRQTALEARQEPVVQEVLLEEQAAPEEATRSTLAGER